MRMALLIRALVPILLGFLAALPLLEAFVQKQHCDPDLRQPHEDPYGYRLRGDRCEGIYVREVSGAAALLVVSFTSGFEDFDPESGELALEWSLPPEAGRLQLRAFGLRPRLYYRMDSLRPAGSTSYTWPLGILHSLSLSRQHLGVVGWTSLKVGQAEVRVYLPLRIYQSPSHLEPGDYLLLVQPSAELAEVFVSLARLGGGGQPESYLQDEAPLRQGYYPADRSIRIPIKRPAETGVYQVEVGAKPKGGGAVSALDLYFYNPSGSARSP